MMSMAGRMSMPDTLDSAPRIQARYTHTFFMLSILLYIPLRKPQNDCCENFWNPKAAFEVQSRTLRALSRSGDDRRSWVFPIKDCAGSISETSPCPQHLSSP